MESVKVLIVEDEALFGELLRQTLSNRPGIEVTEVARDGESAVRLARQLRPDAVLMDIELPGDLDGIAAAQIIKKENARTGIVFLSAHHDWRYVTSIPIDDGMGWSYLLKQSVQDLETVVRAIEGSISGLMVIDPEVMASLEPREDSQVARLSRRQQEVLSLVAQGFSNAAIARQLTLQEKSVETYINAIYQQLQVSGEQEINARVKATLVYLNTSQSRA